MTMAIAREKPAHERDADFSLITANFARIALESVAAGLIVMDLAGRIRYMNLAATQLLERTLEQLRGLPWSECLSLIDENTRQLIPDPVGACLASGKTAELSVFTLLTVRDGREIPVEGSVAPFCWLDDDVFGTVMMLRDATPSRNLLRQRPGPALRKDSYREARPTNGR
jgi:PAS domain S-box-containing protein